VDTVKDFSAFGLVGVLEQIGDLGSSECPETPTVVARDDGLGVSD
jgi:hypothetical protein